MVVLTLVHALKNSSKIDHLKQYGAPNSILRHSKIAAGILEPSLFLIGGFFSYLYLPCLFTSSDMKRAYNISDILIISDDL